MGRLWWGYGEDPDLEAGKGRQNGKDCGTSGLALRRPWMGVAGHRDVGTWQKARAEERSSAKSFRQRRFLRGSWFPQLPTPPYDEAAAFRYPVVARLRRTETFSR